MTEPESDPLHTEIAALRDEVKLLNSHRFVRLHNSVPKLLAFQFARGAAFGLGTILGASLVLSIVIWSLSQIEIIPIIGDWAKELLVIIEPTIDEISEPEQ